MRLVALVVFVLFAGCGGHEIASPDAVRPSASRLAAGALEMPMYRPGGGHADLHEVLAHVAVVALVRTQPDTRDSASRRQAVLLLNLAHRYDNLKVALIAVDLAPSTLRHRGLLTNLYYDWHVSSEPRLLLGAPLRPFVIDPKEVPTTYLVSEGRVVHAWRGRMAPGVLGVAVTKALGLLP